VAEILNLGDNPVGMLQDDLPLRGQADVPMATLDNRRPEILFQEANGGR
jgi:hypothetical protein